MLLGLQCPLPPTLKEKHLKTHCLFLLVLQPSGFWWHSWFSASSPLAIDRRMWEPISERNKYILASLGMVPLSSFSSRLQLVKSNMDYMLVQMSTPAYLHWFLVLTKTCIFLRRWILFRVTEEATSAVRHQHHLTLAWAASEKQTRRLINAGNRYHLD